MRVGFGYDVHRMTAGRALVLGGVDIPYYKGLDGHSDADVLLHAVCDALLGAAGKDDIGRHFPDNDITFRDISSMELLRRVHRILSESGFKVNNIDTTLVLEEPKIAPFREKMCSNIAEVLLIDPKQVSVKATTTEGLGVIGSGAAAAAYCVCSIE